MKKFAKKRGFSLPVILGLVGFGVGIVVLGITLGMGATVLDEMNSTVTSTVANDAISASMGAVGDLADWQSIIVIAGVALVIISAFLTAFGFGMISTGGNR